MDTHRREPDLIAALDDLAELARLEDAVQALDPGAKPAGFIIAPATGSGPPPRYVAIVAGSFNPLTLAHTALAGAALATGADEVYLALSRHIIDKGVVARPTIADRALVLALVARANDRIGCALFNRGLYADQAVAARALFPHATRLAFVVGFDKAVQIFDPSYYDDRTAALERLFAVAELVVAPRGDAGPDQLRALVNREENQRFASRVRLLPFDPAYAHDSATRVRALAQARLPVDALVPDETRALIALANPYALSCQDPAGRPLDAYGQRQARLRAYRLGQ